MSCHRVHGVFNGIPLFSELSSSFSDFLERCGELLLSPVPSSSSFEAQLCKNALDIIGEVLCSTAISRTVFCCETTTNYVMSVPQLPLWGLPGELFWPHKSVIPLNLFLPEEPIENPKIYSLFNEKQIKNIIFRSMKFGKKYAQNRLPSTPR